MPTAEKDPKVDAVLSAAVDQARAAAEEVSGVGDVGEYLGYSDVSERLGSHRFATTGPGYRGWHWTVTVARIARSRNATVCEVELLPGEDALLAPAWVPWAERLSPGDVGPGDWLPVDVHDDRVVPGHVPDQDDPAGVALDAEALVLLGAWREHVPSRQTLQDAAERWEDNILASGASFVEDASAFVVPLSGYLGQVYGVCVNEFSPMDGRVVQLDSVTRNRRESAERPSVWPEAAPVVDEFELDLQP